jgi:Glycosyl transferase family 11
MAIGIKRRKNVMILFPDIGRYGRLGNQMFQLAALKALSLRNNCEAFLPNDIDEREVYGQICLLKYFKHNIKKQAVEAAQKFTGTHYEQNKMDNACFRFDNAYLDVGPNTAVKGYFESEQYFAEFRDEVVECFEFVSELEIFATQYINEVRSQNPQKEIVGIHIRMADYIYWYAQQEKIEFEPAKEIYLGKTVEFVTKTIETYFGEDKYTFLIFCGGNTAYGNSNVSDISMLREVAQPWRDAKYCEVDSAIKDLAIMTKCDHMILTSKSTMAWWGAYLNKNPKKRIYVPRKPTGPNIYGPDFFWAKEFNQIEYA